MTAFVLWMILWPIGCDLCRSYRIKVTGKKYSEEITGAAGRLLDGVQHDGYPRSEK